MQCYNIYNIFNKERFSTCVLSILQTKATCLQLLFNRKLMRHVKDYKEKSTTWDQKWETWSVSPYTPHCPPIYNSGSLSLHRRPKLTARWVGKWWCPPTSPKPHWPSTESCLWLIQGSPNKKWVAVSFYKKETQSGLDDVPVHIFVFISVKYKTMYLNKLLNIDFLIL